MKIVRQECRQAAWGTPVVHREERMHSVRVPERSDTDASPGACYSRGLLLQGPATPGAQFSRGRPLQGPSALVLPGTHTMNQPALAPDVSFEKAH
ncbi:unnamed protein product [Boreogadus saida]